jgi:hypothetical protein
MPLIYDCEIVNMIPAKRERPVPGIQYCQGWTDYTGMGISVIGTFDYATGEYAAFLPDMGGLQGFQALVRRADCIIGFNNHGFDDPLVRAHGITFGCDLTPEGVAACSIDLRVECLRATGIPMDQAKYIKGFSLPVLAGVNLGAGKTEEGALAPILWQRGERQRVIDYCLNDVKLTKGLIDQALATGWLYDPREYGRRDGSEACGCVAQTLKLDLHAAIQSAARTAKVFKLQ